MVLLIALIAGGALLAIIALCHNYITANRYTISSRIEQYVEKGNPLTSVPSVSPASPKSLGWRMKIRNMSKHFESLQWFRLIEHKLIQAGLPIRGAEFMAICLGVAVMYAIIFLVFSGSIPLCLMGGVMGFGMPFLILNLKINKRRKAFNDQLGDTIVLIANALRTGYSFMQAIEMVSREMPKPIGEEFARVLKEMNLGITTEDALNNMAKRVNSEDLDLVITAVLIQRQVGGNLAVVLDSIANTIRERIKIKGQIRTLTAQGKISGLIIGMLPLVIGGVIYLLNPTYMSILFVHPMGKMALAAGVASQFIGMMVIRKIINIDI
ncbi:MAG: type II secretion system F family protein [Sporomusaceae bacterium]|nr:type II secretion system F family protein [Sporomusaceae bacterium]